MCTSLHKFAEEYCRDNPGCDPEHLSKTSGDFLRNVFNAVGVPISDFKKVGKLRCNEGYLISTELKNRLIDIYEKTGFPTAGEIDDCFNAEKYEYSNKYGEQFSQLTGVINAFLERNYRGEVYYRHRKRVNKKIRSIISKLNYDIKEIKKASEEATGNLVSLACLNIDKYIDIEMIVMYICNIIENNGFLYCDMCNNAEYEYFPLRHIAIIDLYHLDSMLTKIIREININKQRSTFLNILEIENTANE